MGTGTTYYMAMAGALKDKRETVQQKDVDLIQELSSCINLEYYPL
jgi:histone H3/H4